MAPSLLACNGDDLKQRNRSRCAYLPRTHVHYQPVPRSTCVGLTLTSECGHRRDDHCSISLGGPVHVGDRFSDLRHARVLFTVGSGDLADQCAHARMAVVRLAPGLLSMTPACRGSPTFLPVQACDGVGRAARAERNGDLDGPRRECLRKPGSVSSVPAASSTLRRVMNVVGKGVSPSWRVVCSLRRGCGRSSLQLDAVVFDHNSPVRAASSFMNLSKSGPLRISVLRLNSHSRDWTVLSASPFSIAQYKRATTAGGVFPGTRKPYQTREDLASAPKT